MKFLIIGLGNFGSALAINLTKLGHEVFGVDSDISKVEQYKGQISHTMQIEVNDLVSAQNLPYKEVDVVVIAIGEDFGASVLTTALFKRLGVKKIIARGISDLHVNILEALQVDEIIMPEEDAANRLAFSLGVKGVLGAFEISGEYAIVDVKVPEVFVGRTVQETGIRNKYHLNIITIKRWTNEKNFLGIVRKKGALIGVVKPDTVLQENDELIVFGKKSDIKRFLKDYEI